MAKGDHFDPPVFCTVCRFEELEGVPHVCYLPLPDTPAWFDPSYEQRMMSRRSADLGPQNLGDVSKPPLTRRQRFPGYNASIGGHSVSEQEWAARAAFASTFGPTPGIYIDKDPPPQKVRVEIRKEVPRAPIPLGPAPKPFGELTTHTMPTMEDFERMVDEWHDSASQVSLHEYMGITWEEYGCVFLSRFYHPLHGRR